ncbi:hypothetical protein CHUAL_013380 [Chamberlinius hualienensis]
MCFSKEIKRVIFRWSVTQNNTCYEQLVDGIRYFDFRLAAKLGTLAPFIIHGMYGGNALDILEEIYRFLVNHRNEFVLLDFQHFYNFTDEIHSFTISSVKRIFGKMLLPYTSSADLSLKSIWRENYQVVVFYRSDYSTKSLLLWPSHWIPNPWPNTDKVSKLIRALENAFEEERNADLFFVTQGVLTPDFTYIFFHLFSNLRQSLAPKATNAVLKWLKTKRAGKKGINIVISDFVGTADNHFSSSVINLNFKLAKTLHKQTKTVKIKRNDSMIHRSRD